MVDSELESLNCPFLCKVLLSFRFTVTNAKFRFANHLPTLPRVYMPQMSGAESCASGGGESSITAPTGRAKRARRDPVAGAAALMSKSTEWCFTYNNYTVDCPDRLASFFDSAGCRYVFQREVAESGTPHLQGVVRFSKPLVPIIEVPKVHELFSRIHWERCRSWEHSIRYCSKDDTRVPDTAPYQNVEVLPIPKIHGWQSHLVDTLLPSFTHRNVYWFWEPRGGVGKSMLVRYLCMTRSALLVSGKDSDIKHGVATYLENTGAGPDLVIVDVPRSSCGYLSYSGIEQVANGCFFSSKYESTMVVTKYPLIVCFANERPNFERMSADRWQVYRIDPEKQALIFEP